MGKLAETDRLDMRRLRESWLIELRAQRKSPATIRAYSIGTDLFLGAPSLNASWTYNPKPDLNLSFSIGNMLVSSRSRASVYYAGPRNSTAMTGREIEIGYSRPHFQISLRKTFN